MKIGIVLAILLPALLQAQEINGPWKGILDAGGQKLEIVFSLSRDKDGNAVASMDVPAQSAKGIPVTVNFMSSDSVSLAVSQIQMQYTGKLKDGRIQGTFTQMGRSFPLDLESGVILSPERPQEPHAPFPYRTEEVVFINSADGIDLAGTLTYPEGYSSKGGFPIAVMVTGSGGQNRDEEVFGHKPFLVIADYLARNGIATLRFDDRGTGKSGGNQSGCTSEDFKRDAESAIEYLRKRGGFGKTGVIGHSEGGMIAFMLGASGKVDFIVSMAGPGIKGDTLLVEQKNAIYRLNGIPARTDVAQTRQEIRSSGNAWLEYFMDHDPRENLRKISVPVMAINGGNDMQVIAESNLASIRNMLSGKNSRNLIKEYPDLNHLFQHCTSDTAMDYYEIRETCAPEVLQDIADWINSIK